VLTVSLPIAFLLGVFAITGVELYSGVLKRCACPKDVRIQATWVADAWETCGKFAAKRNYMQILNSINSSTIAIDNPLDPQAISPGRHCHSTLSLAAIDCHCCRI
jgi:hypothetical protein